MVDGAWIAMLNASIYVSECILLLDLLLVKLYHQLGALIFTVSAPGIMSQIHKYHRRLGEAEVGSEFVN